MKLLSIANEASFNLKRSQFQSQTEPVLISKEAFLLYFISKIVRDTPKIVRDARWINPLFEASVTHIISLEINILSTYFLEIVMGDG